MMAWIAVLGAGVGLGVFFFAGLRWTIARGLTADNPALWFVGGFWLRSAVVAAGICLVSQADWRRYLLCLVGFQMARGFRYAT